MVGDQKSWQFSQPQLTCHKIRSQVHFSGRLRWQYIFCLSTGVPMLCSSSYFRNIFSSTWELIKTAIILSFISKPKAVSFTACLHSTNMDHDLPVSKAYASMKNQNRQCCAFFTLLFWYASSVSTDRKNLFFNWHDGIERCIRKRFLSSMVIESTYVKAMQWAQKLRYKQRYAIVWCAIEMHQS